MTNRREVLQIIGWVAVAIIGMWLSGCSYITHPPEYLMKASVDSIITPVEESLSPIRLSPQTHHSFSFLYKYIQETEFVLCLEGEDREKKIFIEVSILAIITSTSRKGVTYEPCKGSKYIGTAHNHLKPDDPKTNICYSSQPDSRSFNMDSRAVIDIVLCGNGKLLWKLRDGRFGIIYFPNLMIPDSTSS